MTPLELKKSIFQLGCKGKLSIQNKNESAEDYCLRKIGLNKISVLKQSDKALVEIPSNWVFVCLGDLCEMSMGQTVLQNEMEKTGDPIYSATIDDKPLGYINHKKNTINLTVGDLVIPARGASIGYITKIKDKCASGTQTTICAKLKDKSLSDFLYVYLFAFKDTLFRYNGAAIPQITIRNISKIIVPIPPPEEQKRMVAKIEELLPLIDKYEEAWSKLEKFNSNFPNKIEKSILQYAVQGKLVKQQSGVESGKELLERITKTNNSINSKKRIQQINSNDVPFVIPKTWVWTRLGQIIDYKIGKTPPRGEPEWWGQDIHWVSIADMIEYGHIKKTREFVSNKAFKEKFKGNISKKGTLLMSFKLTVGRVSILDVDAVHNEAIISIYPIINDSDIMKMYLFYVLPFLTSFGETKDAIKGRTLNDTSIRNLLIPLPPLEEQKRIVAKIEELLPLCKQLIKK